MGIGVVRTGVGMTEGFTNHACRGTPIQIAGPDIPEGEAREAPILLRLFPAVRPYRGLNSENEKPAHDWISGVSRCSGLPAFNTRQAEQGGTE